jgi:putative Ig domain-containing protein
MGTRYSRLHIHATEWEIFMNRIIIMLLFCLGFAASAHADGRVFPPDNCSVASPFMAFNAIADSNVYCNSGQQIFQHALPACLPDQVVTFTGGSFVCKNVANPPNCGEGEFLTFTNDAYGCGAVDSDIPTCGPNQVLSYNGVEFVCVPHTGNIPACGANQFLTYNGSDFQCAQPTTTVPVCGAGQVLTGMANNTFMCVASSGASLPTDCLLADTLIFAGVTWACASDLPVWNPIPSGEGYEAPRALITQSFSVTLSATDDDGPVTYSKVSGAAWLSLNTSTGVVSGTAPASPGEAYITVRATDQNGHSRDQTFGFLVEGASVGGYLWAAGGYNQTCNGVCASYGKTCNLTGTKNYAGSSGSDANCQAVLSALGKGTGSVNSVGYTGAVGCSYYGSARYRNTGATTCAAAGSDDGSTPYRVCACQ